MIQLMTNWSMEALRRCLDQGKLVWRKHTLERMIERDIARSEVVAALRNGEIVEHYEGDRPFPSALIHVPSGKPLHVVAALDEARGECHVITVYRPDLAHFEPDLKTRRKL